MKRAAKIAFPDIVFVDSIHTLLTNFKGIQQKIQETQLPKYIICMYRKLLKDYEIVQKNFNTIYNIQFIRN